MSAPIHDTDKGYGYKINFGLDAAGNPNSVPPFPSPPAWTVDDGGSGAAGALVVAADGLSAQAPITGKLGTVTVQVSIPDSTDGVFKATQLTDAFPVVGAEASTATLDATPL